MIKTLNDVTGLINKYMSSLCEVKEVSPSSLPDNNDIADNITKKKTAALNVLINNKFSLFFSPFLFKNRESRYYLIVSLPGAPADRLD